MSHYKVLDRNEYYVYWKYGVYKRVSEITELLDYQFEIVLMDINKMSWFATKSGGQSMLLS